MVYMVTFTIFYHQYIPNVSIYTIHGSYGLLRLFFVFRPRARFLTYFKRLQTAPVSFRLENCLGDKVPLKPSSGLHVAWNLDPLHVMVI